MQWVLWSMPNTNIERKTIISFLEKAGGIEKVEKEASIILNEFYSLPNREQLLYQVDFKKAPSIVSLGNSVKVVPFPENKSFPAVIQVKYVSRMREKIIFIFDPKASLDLNKNLFVQVVNNIFIPNYSFKE